MTTKFLFKTAEGFILITAENLKNALALFEDQWYPLDDIISMHKLNIIEGSTWCEKESSLDAEKT